MKFISLLTGTEPAIAAIRSLESKKFTLHRDKYALDINLLKQYKRGCFMKILMILEVSRKQNYIFSSRRLKENVVRSQEIAYVTSSAFFTKTANEYYLEERNLIYSGGGHTVLQFDDQNQARGFAKQITKAVLVQYPGMELFAKQLPYDEKKMPGENLITLSSALEEKKALRASSIRQLSFGVEKEDIQEKETEIVAGFASSHSEQEYSSSIEEIAGEERFIAVIHIDGNSMGKRVQNIYAGQLNWDTCCKTLRQFSKGVEHDFQTAFDEMTAVVKAKYKGASVLPLRPIILAGDDICFITAGSIGLECARLFLEALSAKTNTTQKEPYAACGGVCIVHKAFPFHRAYQMAEALCKNAKEYGASIDADGRISALDWHIEFGQLKESLFEIRKDYISDDSESITLRPVSVVVPHKLSAETNRFRTYRYFQESCEFLHGCEDNREVARGKIKGLREILKQGKLETDHYLVMQNVQKLANKRFLFDAVELYDLLQFWG